MSKLNSWIPKTEAGYKAYYEFLKLKQETEKSKIKEHKEKS